MPIYEYECTECGRVFEKIQRFSDDPLTEYECETCGQTTPVKKRVSAAAFHLKGGGWYVTDFRDGGKKKGAAGKDSKDTKSTGDAGDSGSGSKSDGAGKSDSASTAKPAAKSAGSAA